MSHFVFEFFGVDEIHVVWEEKQREIFGAKQLCVRPGYVAEWKANMWLQWDRLWWINVKSRFKMVLVVSFKFHLYTYGFFLPDWWGFCFWHSWILSLSQYVTYISLEIRLSYGFTFERMLKTLWKCDINVFINEMLIQWRFVYKIVWFQDVYLKLPLYFL